MYDLVVKTHITTWQPRHALTEDEVPVYVKDALAMLGRALPASLTEPGFADRLAETGEYRVDVDDVKITVRRRA